MRAPILHGVDDVLAFWLGLAVPPVARAIEEAAWRPDARHAYCAVCGADRPLGDPAGPRSGRWTCAVACRRQVPADGVVRLGAHAGALREWVLDIKHRRRWQEMAIHLGEELGRAMEGSLIADGVIDRERVVVVPMPMPWMRRLDRGIDHAGCIAAGVGRRLDAPVAAVLGRRHGRPQVARTARARRRSGEGGFRVRRRRGGWALRPLHVVLVDDVMTTGASIRGALHALGAVAPARVAVAVVAVTADPGAPLQKRGGVFPI